MTGAGVRVAVVFAVAAVVAAVMGCLSIAVARGRPSPAALHPRPAAPRPLPAVESHVGG